MTNFVNEKESLKDLLTMFVDYYLFSCSIYTLICSSTFHFRIVVTSPIEAHPNTELLDKLLGSLAKNLKGFEYVVGDNDVVVENADDDNNDINLAHCNVIIACDGKRERVYKE
jgi:hypothetical protein